MRTVVKEELEPPRRDRIRVKNKTYPLPETIDRLEAVLQAKNITIEKIVHHTASLGFGYSIGA